jgi:hypothetical protein
VKSGMSYSSDWVLGGVAAAILALSGCAGSPSTEVAGSDYCHRTRGMPDAPRHRTCTTAPIPAPQVEAAAKRFEPVADAGTLYVVRRSRGDSSNLLPVDLGHGVKIDTIPNSFIRVRMAPGDHTVAFDWHGVRRPMPVHLREGTITFIELDETDWLQYEWVGTSPARARQEALLSKMIADVDLRTQTSMHGR